MLIEYYKCRLMFLITITIKFYMFNVYTYVTYTYYLPTYQPTYI